MRMRVSGTRRRGTVEYGKTRREKELLPTRRLEGTTGSSITSVGALVMLFSSLAALLFQRFLYGL